MVAATETVVNLLVSRGCVETRLPVCAASELAPGASCVVHTDVGLVSVWNVGGRFHAIDDLCPHMRESLGQGALSGGCVTCPAHGWRFDVRTGKSPDFDGLSVDTFPVSVQDGVVYLHLARRDEGMDWDGAADPDDIDEPLFD